MILKELLFNILSYCNNKEIVNVYTLVNKYWNNVCQDDLFWKYKFISDGYDEEILSEDTYFIPYYIKYIGDNEIPKLYVKNLFIDKEDALKEIKNYIYNEIVLPKIDTYIENLDLNEKELKNLNIDELYELINDIDSGVIEADENILDYQIGKFDPREDQLDNEFEEFVDENVLREKILYRYSVNEDGSGVHQSFGLIKFKFKCDVHKLFLFKKYCITYHCLYMYKYETILLNLDCVCRLKNSNIKCKNLAKKFKDKNKKNKIKNIKSDDKINILHEDSLYVDPIYYVKKVTTNEDWITGIIVINFKKIIGVTSLMD